jgi:hypothetical protein
MRYDLKFVLLRTDLGLKLRDPKYPDKSQWIVSRNNNPFTKNLAVVIAIGYPF